MCSVKQLSLRAEAQVLRPDGADLGAEKLVELVLITGLEQTATRINQS